MKYLGPGGFAGEFLFNFALIQLFLISTVIPHELGHAIAARALGWKVYQITIGTGAQLWKRNIWGIHIDFRCFPLSGGTFMVPADTRLYRLKFFLAILAGPFVNAVLAGVTILAFGGTIFPLNLKSLPPAADLFVLANVFVFVMNLWPRDLKTSHGPATDGKRLLQLISPGKAAAQEVDVLRYVFEMTICREQSDDARAKAWCEEGLSRYPEDPQILTLAGIVRLDAQDYDGARETFMKVLAMQPGQSSRRWFHLNNIAYAAALSRRPELLPEADSYSLNAYTAAPWSSAIVSTRGTVLVALGRYEEGLQLLRKALEDSNSARNKAETACHIATALTKLGRHEEAHEHLKLAAELDPRCTLLARTRNDLVSPTASHEEVCRFASAESPVTL